jgi:hypothetical protein
MAVVERTGLPGLQRAVLRLTAAFAVPLAVAIAPLAASTWRLLRTR